MKSWTRSKVEIVIVRWNAVGKWRSMPLCISHICIWYWIKEGLPFSVKSYHTNNNKCSWHGFIEFSGTQDASRPDSNNEQLTFVGFPNLRSYNESNCIDIHSNHSRDWWMCRNRWSSAIPFTPAWNNAKASKHLKYYVPIVRWPLIDGYWAENRI